MGLIRRIAKRILGGGDSKPAARRSPPAASGPITASDDSAAPSLARLDCGAQEIKERLDAGEQIVILDVRTLGELASGTIPGAVHIPVDELEERWREVESANEIVCYCAMGGRSLIAAKLLREKGLFNATSLEGGIGAWTDAGGELA